MEAIAMIPLAFRLATASDVATLQPLIQRAYRGEASRAGWTHEADILGGERIAIEELAAMVGDPSERLLIAERDRAAVGCVRVSDLGDGNAYLGLLTVDPVLQGGGTGRALIAAAEALAREAYAARRIEMTVIDTRHELIAWYRRRGYAPAGVRPFPFPTDPPLTMVVLDKPLGQ